MGVAERLAAGAMTLLVVLALIGGRAAHAAPPDSSAGSGARPASSGVEASERGEGPGAPPRTSAAFGLDLRDAAAAFDPERMRLIWEPASVAWPLTPLVAGSEQHTRLAAHLDQRVAMLEGREPAPSVRGAVDLDAQRSVGVWLAALETVRVRQFGPPVPLHFIRGVDGNAAVIEGARELAPGPGGERRFELFQPPSTGAVWSIEAEQPTRVMIERVAPRPLRYAAVEVEQALLEWIHARDSIEALPTLLIPADDLARRLHLHAALAEELLRLGGGDERLAKGVEAWRMLAAINEIDQPLLCARPRPQAALEARAHGRGSLEDRGQPRLPARAGSRSLDDHPQGPGPAPDLGAQLGARGRGARAGGAACLCRGALHPAPAAERSPGQAQRGSGHGLATPRAPVHRGRRAGRGVR